MNINDLEAGLHIHINHNIEESERKFGSCAIKTEMANTVQVIRDIHLPSKRIYVKQKDNLKISFFINDIQLANGDKKKATFISEPVIFDPMNLDID